ncbi:hypothetical protein ABK040_015078 [Willaertia magna]
MEKVVESSSLVASPVFDSHGVMYYCSPTTGDVLLGNGEIVLNTKGSPNSMIFGVDGSLIVCDMARQSLQLEILAKDYNDKEFVGPHSLAIDSQGTIYFTDSGPLGETSLENPKGSVYCLHNDGVLTHLAYECLCYPSGVAVSPLNEDVIYVAETMKNRILRFVMVNGAFYSSVFCQFSGSLGPISICCDDRGNLYVGVYEFKEFSKEGRILVITPGGNIAKEIIFDSGPEINSLYFKNGYLFVCENNAVYQFNVDEN